MIYQLFGRFLSVENCQANIERNLSDTEHNLYKLRHEKPGGHRKCKTDERTTHPLLRLIDMRTVSSDPTRYLHTKCMIDQCEDADRPCEQEKVLDRIDDDFWDICIVEVTTSGAGTKILSKYPRGITRFYDLYISCCGTSSRDLIAIRTIIFCIPGSIGSISLRHF